MLNPDALFVFESEGRAGRGRRFALGQNHLIISEWRMPVWQETSPRYLSVLHCFEVECTIDDQLWECDAYAASTGFHIGLA